MTRKDISRRRARKKRLGWASVALTALLGATLPAVPAAAASAAMAATVVAIDETVESGGHAVYRVVYQCSNLTFADCRQPVITVPAPVGLRPDGEPVPLTGTPVLHGGGDVLSASGDPFTIALRDMGPGESGEFTLTWDIPNFTTLPGTTFPVALTLAFADESAPDGKLTTEAHTPAPLTVEAEGALTAVKQMVEPVRETLVRPDEPVTYRIYDCNPTTASLGALDYTDLVIVDTLPKGATFVSASAGGVYDPVAETVTWTTPTPARDDCTKPSQVHEVTVIYSDANFVKTIPKGEAMNTFHNRVDMTAVALDGETLTAFDTRTHTFVTPDAAGITNFLAEKNSSKNNYLHTDTTSLYQWGMLSFWHGIPGYESGRVRPAVVVDRVPCLMNGKAVSPPLPSTDSLSMSYPGRISVPSDQCTTPAFNTEEFRFDLTTTQHIVQIEVATWNGVLPQTYRYVKPNDLAGQFMLGIHRPAGGPWMPSLELPANEIVTDIRIVSLGQDGVADWWAVRGSSTQAFADSGLLAMSNTYTPFYGVEIDPGDVPVAGIVHGAVNKSAAERFATPQPDPQVVKTAVTAVDGLRPGATPSWQISIANGANGKVPLRPMLVDVLPIGLEPIESSIRWSGLDAVGEPTLERSTTEIDGIERTVLTWTWPDGTELGVDDPRPTVTFDTEVTLAAAEGPHSGAEAQRAVLFDMNHTLTDRGTGAVTDSHDLDGDGNTDELVSESTVGWTGLASSGAAIEKTVRGALDADWSRDGLTNATFDGTGSQVDYRLAVSDPNSSTLKDLVIYDVLPHVGDKAISGVLAGLERGSQWDVTFESILTKPEGVTIEYSTSYDPCRPEVFDEPSGTAVPEGCDADWSAELPADPSTVKSLRIVFAELAPTFEPEYIEYRTNAPALTGADDLALTDPTAVANNNVAWQTDRVTSAGSVATLLASEASVVGVRRAAGHIGDRIWLDENRDGIQSAGEPGVAGVTLQLLDQAGQPVNGADGTPLRAVTDDDGEYRFTVPLGTWSVAIVDVPAQYELTAHKAGSEDATDSDFAAVGVPVAATIADPVRNGDGANIVMTLDAGLVRAGVSITKDDGLAIVRPGESTTYAITVTNTAPTVTAEEVVVTDALPAELEFVSATGGGVFDEPNGVVTWTLGALAPGEARILEVTATVADGTAPDTEITNVATLAGEFDCVGACAATDVDRTPPRVTIEKDDHATTVGVGEQLRYDLFVENRSDATAATGVVVVDTLPEHLEFVSASDDGVFDAAARTITWQLGELAPGSGRVVQVHVNVAASAPAGATIANTASVATAEGCLSEGDCLTEDVDRTPDVSIAKDDGKDIVQEGFELTFDITVTNNAAWDAPHTVVTDVLPSTLTFVSASDEGVYDEETHSVTWQLGTLGGDSERVVSVVATVVDGLSLGTPVVNTASVTTEHGCIGESRCSATDVDHVVPKQGEPGEGEPGEGEPGEENPEVPGGETGPGGGGPVDGGNGTDPGVGTPGGGTGPTPGGGTPGVGTPGGGTPGGGTPGAGTPGGGAGGGGSTGPGSTNPGGGAGGSGGGSGGSGTGTVEVSGGGVGPAETPGGTSSGNGSAVAAESDGLANTGSTVATLAWIVGGLLLMAGAALLLLRRRKAFGMR